MGCSGSVEGGTQGPGVAMAGRERRWRQDVGTKQQPFQMAGVCLIKSGWKCMTKRVRVLFIFCIEGSERMESECLL